MAGADEDNPGPTSGDRAGEAYRRRCCDRGQLGATPARPPERRGPDLCHRLCSISRLDQRDGAGLRCQLPNHQGAPQPYRRESRFRRYQPRAVPHGDPRAAEPRRAQGGRRHSRTGGIEVTEERRQILEMLAEGKINADEADRLIGALGGASSTAAATATVTAVQTKPLPKFIRIMVDAKEGKDDKPIHINVRVPIALLRAGVRLASMIPSVA